MGTPLNFLEVKQGSGFSRGSIVLIFSIVNSKSQCSSGGLFVIQFQVPEFVLQQQKNQNSVIREIRAKKNRVTNVPMFPITQ